MTMPPDSPVTTGTTQRRSLFWRFSGALKLLFVGLFVFMTCGPAVDAQEESPAAFFRADRERMQLYRHNARPTIVQRPTNMVHRAAPPRAAPRLARPSAGPRAIARPPSQPGVSQPEEVPAEALVPGGQAADAAAPPDATSPYLPPPSLPSLTRPAPVAAKPVEPSFVVAVIGDSLGTLLAQGLSEAFADKPDIAILRKARENTGLVRDDYYDWVKGARDLASGSDRINLVVMMIGSNDRQVMRDAGASVELRSPRWNQTYGDRIEAIAQAFRDKKISVVWVGLPVMKNDRFAADMAAFNELFKDRIGKVGGTFIDTWEPFLDDRSQYAAYGPDVNGQYQKLRSADGVHFTKPGARKLAHFLEAEIKHAVEASRPKVELEIAAIAPKPAPIDAEQPTSVPLPPVRGSGDPLVLVPLPPATPQVVIPVKPAEGAVVALTTPNVSPGGRLVARATISDTATDSQALLDRVLVQGRPLEARPGRADDFSWPRR